MKLNIRSQHASLIQEQLLEQSSSTPRLNPLHANRPKKTLEVSSQSGKSSKNNQKAEQHQGMPQQIGHYHVETEEIQKVTEQSEKNSVHSNKQDPAQQKIQESILKEYQNLGRLGSGAYGHVYKVIHKQTKEIFALKKVFSAFQNQVDSQRTYRQIVYLSKLKHKNVVKLKKVIRATNDQDLYLLFEYVQSDLFYAIKGDLLNELHKKYIIYQIARCLNYVHGSGLVHRDVKPSNILINPECQIKLCDFGLSRSLYKYTTDDSHQQPLMTEFIATRWYRAPEVLFGSQLYGVKSDMWSFGCLIYELYARRPLLPGKDTVGQIQKVLEFKGFPNQSERESFKISKIDEILDMFDIQKVPLNQYFQYIQHEQVKQLLIHLLQYNPQKRWSAQDVLNSSFLEQFRDFRETQDSKNPVSRSSGNTTSNSSYQRGGASSSSLTGINNYSFLSGPGAGSYPLKQIKTGLDDTKRKTVQTYRNTIYKLYAEGGSSSCCIGSSVMDGKNKSSNSNNIKDKRKDKDKDKSSIHVNMKAIPASTSSGLVSTSTSFHQKQKHGVGNNFSQTHGQFVGGQSGHSHLGQQAKSKSANKMKSKRPTSNKHNNWVKQSAFLQQKSKMKPTHHRSSTLNSFSSLNQPHFSSTKSITLYQNQKSSTKNLRLKQGDSEARAQPQSQKKEDNQPQPQPQTHKDSSLSKHNQSNKILLSNNSHPNIKSVLSQQMKNRLLKVSNTTTITNNGNDNDNKINFNDKKKTCLTTLRQRPYLSCQINKNHNNLSKNKTFHYQTSSHNNNNNNNNNNNKQLQQQQIQQTNQRRQHFNTTHRTYKQNLFFDNDQKCFQRPYKKITIATVRYKNGSGLYQQQQSQQKQKQLLRRQQQQFIKNKQTNNNKNSLSLHCSKSMNSLHHNSLQKQKQQQQKQSSSLSSCRNIINNRTNTNSDKNIFQNVINLNNSTSTSTKTTTTSTTSTSINNVVFNKKENNKKTQRKNSNNGFNGFNGNNSSSCMYSNGNKENNNTNVNDNVDVNVDVNSNCNKKMFLKKDGNSTFISIMNTNREKTKRQLKRKPIVNKSMMIDER